MSTDPSELETPAEPAPAPDAPDAPAPAAPEAPAEEEPPMAAAPFVFNANVAWEQLKDLALQHRETPCTGKHRTVGELLSDFIARAETGNPIV